MSENKARENIPPTEPVDADDEAGIPSVSDGQIDIPDELPILGMDNFVLFPFMIAPMIIGESHAKQLVDDALRRDRLLGVFLKKESEKPEHFENLYDVGTLAIILKMLRMPDGSLRLLLHGTDRIRIARHIAEEPYPKANVVRLADENADSWPVKAMVRSIQNMISKIVKMGHLPEDMLSSVNEMSDPGKLADLAIAHLSVKIQERQEILALTDIEKRLEKVLEILGRETKVLELGSEIQNKVMSSVDKRQREYMLREQLKAIQKELGEGDDQNPDLAELSEAIKKAKMPKHAHDASEKELKRLGMLHPSSPEYAVSRNYLDWLVSLPWAKSTRDNMDIEKAQAILDEDHYDLAPVKERILEYLAVIKLKKQIRGPILCFVGPPGVGKTSLGRSIARSLGRKFGRMSFGGMHDEAEIRGHRRTYIGSMPGRILKTLRDCGSRNPLIMLDEIDKIGQDFRGDPSSALLEVLDPEQNSTFTDHYLDMPFDLSNVMFITTANTLDTIPAALQDRMEVLRLSGYTAREKREIATRYLVPRAYENTGVTEKQAVFTPESIMALIDGYTREAGVRNLEREIQNVCRKVARRIAEGDKKTVTIGAEDVRAFLGPERVYSEMAKRMGQPGVAIGLAWTPTGGEILFVEATAVPGSGQLLLTGQLGDVMKESGMAAVSFLHSHARVFNIEEHVFSKKNFHVHVPAGATPKDGPSAGITLATALCSLLIDRPIKDYLAMTGEITLKGNVLPVGGIKEKVLAAHRAGIKELILPTRAKLDLEKDIPDEVLQGITYHFVDHVSEVFRIAFPNDAGRLRLTPIVREAPPAPQPAVHVVSGTAPSVVSGGSGHILKIEPDKRSSRSRRLRSRRTTPDETNEKNIADDTPVEDSANELEPEEETPVRPEEKSEPPRPAAEPDKRTEDTREEAPAAEVRKRRSRRGGRGRGRSTAERSVADKPSSTESGAESIGKPEPPTQREAEKKTVVSDEASPAAAVPEAAPAEEKKPAARRSRSRRGRGGTKSKDAAKKPDAPSKESDDE